MNRYVKHLACFVLGVTVTLTAEEVVKIYDIKCYDTLSSVSFYTVKDGIEYCFYRKRDYPYRISGGIIGVKE